MTPEEYREEHGHDAEYEDDEHDLCGVCGERFKKDCMTLICGRIGPNFKHWHEHYFCCDCIHNFEECSAAVRSWHRVRGHAEIIFDMGGGLEVRMSTKSRPVDDEPAMDHGFADDAEELAFVESTRAALNGARS